MSKPDSESVLRSGAFALDLDRQVLTRDGAPVALGGRPLRILEILMREEGRVVTRDALKRALWPDATRIDTGRRLNTAMRAVREALDDEAVTPRFVETVRGRGYRWIGPNAAPAARSPLRRQRLAGLAMAFAAALLVGSVRSELPALPDASQRAHFVALAAMAAEAPDDAFIGLGELLEQAPGYTAAHVLRADLAVGAWREHPTTESLGAVRVVLDDANKAGVATADFRVLRAEVLLGADWDWRAAEREYRRVLATTPTHLGARRGLAWLLLNAGREEEAFAVLEPVLARADLSEAMRAEIGWFLLRMRRPSLALIMCGGDAAAVNLLACRHTAEARLGDLEAARRSALLLMRAVHAAEGNVAEVRRGSSGEGYARFLQWRTESFLPPDGAWFQRAQLYADGGLNAAAMESLDRAFEAREPALVKLRTSEEFAALRGTPRFEEMLRAVGPV